MIYTDPVADIIALVVCVNTLLSTHIVRKQKSNSDKIDEVHDAVTETDSKEQ